MKENSPDYFAVSSRIISYQMIKGERKHGQQEICQIRIEQNIQQNV